MFLSPLRFGKLPCLSFRLYFLKKRARDYVYNNPERIEEFLEHDDLGALSTQDVEFLREYVR